VVECSMRLEVLSLPRSLACFVVVVVVGCFTKIIDFSDQSIVS
jgi:hypothetical protein